MNTDERWNLDRKPTAIERGVGIGGALLLSIVGMIGLYFSVFVIGNLVASLATGAFTTLSIFILGHFIFTEGRSLHRPEITRMAVVFIIARLAMLVGSFFADSSRQRLFILSLGAFGVSGGILNLSKAKKPTERK